MTGSFRVPRPHDLIWVRGRDAVAFLEGLVSQSVASTPEGAVRRSLLLTPRGKLVAPLWLLRGQDEIGLAVEGGFAAEVISSIERFKIRVDAAITREPRALTEVWGAAADDLVAPGAWKPSPVLCADLPLIHGTVRRVITSAEVAVATASEGEAEAARIAMGEPRLGVDVDEDTIPEEAGLVAGAVDFDKGCYLGQELVARIDSRGHVNRHLRGLRSEGPLAATSAVRRAGTEVGMVTSVAVDRELGTIALAMIRRQVEVGDEVEVGATAAVVTGLPIPRNPSPRTSVP